MASNQRDAAKKAFWRYVVERQWASGLSVREFCRRERLSETLLHAWRRTIAQRSCRRALGSLSH